MKAAISQEQTMDISFLTRREVSQPKDVEGRVSSDIHRIYKTGSRAGCFCNTRNTRCSTRNSKRDRPEPCIGTSPLGSITLSWWKKEAVCCQELMRNTSYILNTSYCTKATNQLLTRYELGILWWGETQGVQRCFCSCACWTPSRTAVSQPLPSPLLFPWPCATCWQKLGGGRRVRGREGVRKWESEKEAAEIIKKKQPQTSCELFWQKLTSCFRNICISKFLFQHGYKSKSYLQAFPIRPSRTRLVVQSMDYKVRMSSPKVNSIVRVVLLKGLTGDLLTFHFILSSESQEIHLRCYLQRGGGEWRCSAVCKKFIGQFISFGAQFSCPPIPIVQFSYFCFLIQRWRASQLCMVKPSVPPIMPWGWA